MSEQNTTEQEKKEAGAASPIIIKKIKKHGHGHHGGAWKIAYADFVTAMMAFFLLMWLIASLNKSQREAIADYFKQPIKTALFGGENYGNSEVPIHGGGTDVTVQQGQVSATNKPVEEKEKGAKAGNEDKHGHDAVDDDEAAQADAKKLEELKAVITQNVDKDIALEGLKKQLRMDIVQDGLRIELLDNKNKPMFDVGSDRLNADFQPTLANIARLLNTVPNKVVIQGYTDASPYDNPHELDYTNWELSSQRANAARRALINGGMKEDRVLSVTGFGSTRLLDTKNPLNPENRRINIIVMKKTAEDMMSIRQGHTEPLIASQLDTSPSQPAS